MNDNETFTVDDRTYIDPNVSLNEQTTFLDRLREAQRASNERISRETQALGSDVSSARGGLVGSEGTWRDRYQTTQINQMVAGLRAAAQAQALSEQLSNELAQKQIQYNQAYRAAVKKEKASTLAPSSGNGGYEEVDVPETTVKKTTTGSIPGVLVTVDKNGTSHYVDGTTGKEIYTVDANGKVLYKEGESQQAKKVESLLGNALDKFKIGG